MKTVQRRLTCISRDELARYIDFENWERYDEYIYYAGLKPKFRFNKQKANEAVRKSRDIAAHILEHYDVVPLRIIKGK